MPEPTNRSLHGSSVDELESKAEALSFILQNVDDLEKLWKAFEKLYAMGVGEHEKGNEEIAYIYLYRSVMCFKYIITKKEFENSDQRFCRIRYGPDVCKAMNMLEILKESLKEPCEASNQSAVEINGIERSIKKTRGNGKTSTAMNKILLDPAPITDELRNMRTKINEDDIYISCKELHAIFVDNPSTSLSTLILDIRTKEDFDKSTLKANNVINIPENVIMPGNTATKLEPLLEERFKPFFRKRGDYDRIVIVDRSSNEIIFGSKISILLSILTKWDVRTEYRSRPVILKGGFEEWHSRYPHCTTNPLFSPQIETKTKNLFNIDTINYPSHDIFGAEKINTNISSSEDMIPRPVIDRSTKPATVEKKFEHETTIISKIENKASIVDFGENHVTRIIVASELSKEKKDEVITKETNTNSENADKLTEVHGPKVHRESVNQIYMFSSDNEFSISEETRNNDQRFIFRDEGDNSENRIVNSKSSNNIRTESGSGSKMKRYSSTPNISKVGMNEGMKPPIDRSTKPSNDDQLNYYTMNSSYIDTGKGLTGLKNIGNTCYMNSIIQCLSNTEPLRKHLCSIDSRKINEESKTRGAVAREVISIIKQLWSNDSGPISCRSLKNIIGQHNEMFSGYDQQDSHEFLTILIDWLHEDLSEPSPTWNLDGANEITGEKAWGEFSRKNNSIIKRLFYGQLKSTVSCSVCKAQSITFEPFSNFSLPLPPDEMGKCSIEDCLKLYTSNDEVDKWQCPKCYDFRRATKKLDITKLPPLLVVHFKRFTSVGGCKKQKTFVDFPETLDMKPFIIGTEHRNSRFQLYAVSNHSGSMESGHYTAYCKNSVDRRWYQFDDQSVYPSSLIRSREAYITFYQTMGN